MSTGLSHPGYKLIRTNVSLARGGSISHAGSGILGTALTTKNREALRRRATEQNREEGFHVEELCGTVDRKISYEKETTGETEKTTSKNRNQRFKLRGSEEAMHPSAKELLHPFSIDGVAQHNMYYVKESEMTVNDDPKPEDEGVT